jgi:hypothetical protein
VCVLEPCRCNLQNVYVWANISLENDQENLRYPAKYPATRFELSQCKPATLQEIS